MALVSIRSVSKVYEPLPRAARLLLRSQVTSPIAALAEVDLDVDAGEVCVVIGPNGAGKSTLFRIVTGLTTPSSGTVKVKGIDMVTEAARARRHIGFAPAEERTLLMRHTCRENLRFHGRLQGMRPRDLTTAIDETLHFVGLGERADDAVVGLSSGMRARLQLARALVHDPEVLVLDEPTSSIDPVSARSIIELVVEAASERGAAVLLSSHRIEEIEALGDRVLLLDGGRTVYDGPLQGFTSKYTGEVVEVTFTKPGAAGRLAEKAASAGVTSRLSGEPPLTVHLDGLSSITDAIALIDDTQEVTSIEDRTPTLVDVLGRAWGDSR